MPPPPRLVLRPVLHLDRHLRDVVTAIDGVPDWHRGSQDRENGRPSFRPLRSLEVHQRCGRGLVETAMYRYTTIIGQRLHIRILSNQTTKAKITCNILGRMTNLGKPISVRIK